jgi:hypothetical protein
MLPVADPRAGAVVAATSSSTIEIAVVAVAVVLLIVVLALRTRRDRTHRLRQGSSTGYFDRDVARYGSGPTGLSVGATPIDPSHQPLAPTFTSASKGARRTKAPKTGAPMPVPSFAAIDHLRDGPVPAFDQVSALGLRPPTSTAPPMPGLVQPPPAPAAPPATAPAHPAGVAAPLPSAPPVPSVALSSDTLPQQPPPPAAVSVAAPTTLPALEIPPPPNPSPPEAPTHP